VLEAIRPYVIAGWTPVVGKLVDGKQKRATVPGTLAERAAIAASILITGVAIFQAALALGLPLGEATFGGSAPTVDGVLSSGFRLVAIVNAIILLMFAWIIITRARLTSSGILGDRVVYWATWGIVAFLILNSLGNLFAPHPVERYAMGAATMLLVALCGFVALRAPAS
jgi:hypothetical protein